MRLQVETTNQFKRDARLAQKRGLRMQKLYDIIELLQEGKSLPPRNRDHVLTGDWEYHRECHVTADWLLIYRIEGEKLRLYRTGSHADLFGS